ncbi:MAG: Gmad2 immunoglobulin-like domain-containing protein [Candidatus Peregrinibacteria bacterium]|nr:Gmad2 immunoglobulin-like domain-containing protein [Candidatus Peregrinibacteria bacterium]
MKKFIFFLLGLILGMAIIWGIAISMQSKTEVEEKGIDSLKTDEPKKEEEVKNTLTKNKNITVTKPLADEEISSPLSIEGTAKGTWFFEAVSFVKVVDENGTELGNGSLRALGNWMTADFIPFKGQISFDKKLSKTGFLIFEKSNPSGLKENAEEFKLPVKFQ